MVIIGSILDLIVLWAVGRWLMPHGQRFLEAHGRMEPNYVGIPIPRGMGIVLWLLVWVQELLLLGMVTFLPLVQPLLQTDDWFIVIDPLEATYRTFAFAATLIFLLGWTDDLIGTKSVKGLKGHWRYCRETGLVSMGAVKAIGTLMSGAWALMALRHGKIPIWEMGIELILWALMTNAMNLLDVRPGRSLKVFLPCSLVVLVSMSAIEKDLFIALVPVFVGGLLLYPHDVQGKGMLGDAGANLLGFTLGYGLLLVSPISLKILLIVVLGYMHKQAETSSLTRLIEQNRLLNWLDRLGRT